MLLSSKSYVYAYTQVLVPWFISFRLCSNLSNETFAIINTQPSNTLGEHGILISNFYHKLFFANSLGREEVSFHKQHYKQIMSVPLQTYPSVYSYRMIFEVFHFFKFQQELKTGIPDVEVLSFIINYM